MEITDLFETAGSFVSIAAAAAFILLLPLYLSQRRDVERMREWMQREPEHPGADIAASEVILDRAEAELEELLGATTSAAAARVTSERPALERITMEREALAPHPRLRGFGARVTQPRALVAIGAAAVLLGAAAIFGSEQLLRGGEEEGRQRAGAIDPAEVQVVVLNGTSVSGLAGKVGSDVAAKGYEVVDATNATESFDQTVVMFADKQRPAAQKIARLLGVTAVQPLDRDTRRLANDADVVVIAGEDRARS